MTRKRVLGMFAATLAATGCAHTMSDEPNTAANSRPFERSTDPIQSTAAVDVDDQGNASAHRNEPPKPDAGLPDVVDTVTPAPP